ncbi:hypothetical protein ACOMHN_031956 [Nucella lapillus]
MKLRVWLAAHLSEAMEEGWDLSSLREEEFEDFCVYIVHDRPCSDRACPNRAQATLPRNLTLRDSSTHPGATLPRNLTLRDSSTHPGMMGVWSVDYIPRGTRFGPVTGEVIHQESECSDLPLRHHWKVFKNNKVHQHIRTSDASRANWVHYVKLAGGPAPQLNLMACQVDAAIYLYTVKPIPPNVELLAWFCRDYADRINCPPLPPPPPPASPTSPQPGTESSSEATTPLDGDVRGLDLVDRTRRNGLEGPPAKRGIWGLSCRTDPEFIPLVSQPCR